MNENPGADLQFLRHTLATLAYRVGKVVRDAPASFAGFRVGESSRTPLEILAHIGDVLDWALALAGGQHVWNDHPPGTWEEETARFFGVLQRLDDASPPAILWASRARGSSRVPSPTL